MSSAFPGNEGPHGRLECLPGALSSDEQEEPNVTLLRKHIAMTEDLLASLKQQLSQATSKSNMAASTENCLASPEQQLLEDTSSSGKSIKCFFLERLPAELRNNIYELAFAAENVTYTAEAVALLTELPCAEVDAEAAVDLFHVAPPQKALVMTCRQINNEAHQMYREAYQKYWLEQRFFVCIDDWSNNKGQRSMNTFKAFTDDLRHGRGMIKPTDFSKIRYLSISGQFPEDPSQSYEYTRTEDSSLWSYEQYDEGILQGQLYCWADTATSWGEDSDENAAKSEAALRPRWKLHSVAASLLSQRFNHEILTED